MVGRHLEENLSAYLANELSADERMQAEKHLNECEECRQNLQKLQRLEELLAQQKGVDPSRDFVGRLRNRIDRDNKVIAYQSRKKIAWVALAAAIVFVLLLLKIYRPVQEPAPFVKHQRPPVTAPQQQKSPEPQMAKQQNPGARPQQELSAEDAAVIANLDTLQNMELLENYDSVENLDLAVMAEDQEKVQ